MKQFIIPVAIIVGLIVFFFLVDRKEFNRHDTIQNVQIEKRLLDNSQPVDYQHIGENREVTPEITPTESKPAETNPATETRAEGGTFPAAVPVVSEEEAEKLNEFAIFLPTVKATVVEGEITERSELPDPKKSDYPNCRFTVHFTGNTIKSGEPCPKELSLIVEGFENYRILLNNNIKKGDKVRCAIIPFEQLPEDFQSTQQADDLELFLLDSYYALDIKTIKNYTDNEAMPVSGIYFSEGNDEYVSLFDRHINQDISEHAKNDQALSVHNDLEKMNALLDGIDDKKISETNKRFAEAWAKEKAKDPPDYNRVGRFVWRNLNNSFWTLPIGTSGILSKPDRMSQQMLDCFLSLKQVLEANGVQLIVSLVPSMNVISARVINQDFKDIPDIQTATYVKQLSEIGVETIYASDRIIKNYNRFPFAYFFPENTHPSDTTQDVLAESLAERLQRYGIKPELDPSLFSEVQIPHAYKNQENYLFPPNCDIGNNQAGKSYTCRDVLYNGEKIKRTKESPIMVIGNSFIETPISTPESLPALLSYKTRSPVDWYRISGFGPFSDILIQLLANPDFYLKDKKVFILQVGTIHITEVNHAEMMLDIAKLDNERALLNNKKMKGHLLLPSNASIDEMTDPNLWGPLSNVEKTVLKIDETGELTLHFKNKQFGIGVADTDPIVCNIPYTCATGTTCKATINEKKEALHSTRYATNSRFFNLAFKIPAGTKEITFKIEGKPGALIAIKDIQIWQ